MAKELTVTGKVFKGFAEAIVKKHGFGSNRMITELENKGEMMILRDIDSRERAGELTKEAANTEFQAIGHSVHWLLDNGYIRRFEFSTETNRKVSPYRNHEYFGLTAKGWAVANKYLTVEAN